jgi:glycosyltransferase involved in cell wall biosynthesis
MGGVMRGIFYFPWDIEFQSGATEVLCAYAEAFCRYGHTLDLCYMHSKNGVSYSNRLNFSVFDRVFFPVNLNDRFRFIEDEINDLFVDSYIPEKGIRVSHLYGAANIIASGQYDFVGIHYTACYLLADMLPCDMPKILFTYDLDSVVKNQYRHLDVTRSQYPIDEEVKRLQKFDLVTVVGPEDFALVRERAPDLNVVVATFCPSVIERREIRESMDNLLFVGSNVLFKRLSIQWFWECVWPELKRLGFDGTLDIVGEISDFAMTLGMDQDSRCKIHGIVGSMDPFFKAADLLISPYYCGAGIKTNILQAIARGLPVVTTRHGLSNTWLTPGHDILVSDNASEFARLIQSAIPFEERKRLSINGLETIRRKHTADIGLQAMVESVSAIVECRANNKFESSNNSLLDELSVRLRAVLRRMHEAKYQRIAIYGAGVHTEWVIREWEGLTGIEIDSIVVTEKSKDTFLWFPVVAIKNISMRAVDAIILSSANYEVSMAITANQYAPNIPLYAIWNPYLKASDQCPEKEQVESIRICADIP